MNQREQENKKRKFIEEDGKKEDKNSESEEQKSLIEIANNQEFREENLDNVDEFGAERNLINQLDNDCLAKVLSYVPLVDRLEMKKVCKKWKEAVAMSWHHVQKIDAGNLPILIHKKESTLKELLNNCCKYLTHLTIDYQYSWIIDVLKNINKNIVYLDINILCSEYYRSIFATIGSLSKLKYIRATFHDEDKDSARNFNFFLNHLMNILPADIEEIHLIASFYDQCGQHSNVPALDKLTNLRCLTLGRFSLSESHIIQSILPNKNTLIYLDVHESSLSDDFIKLFTELVHLEHLNLGECEDLNHNMIIEIARNCQKLKYLSLSSFETYNTIQRSIFRELKYLKNLEHLDLSVIEESNDDNVDIMSEIVDNCKKLKYLNVGKGRNFTTLDIKAITKLNNLQYLNLYWAKVDSQSFINIVDNCLELKELLMDFYYGLHDNIPLEKLTNLKKLEKLDLGGCKNLTGNLLSKIVNNCENLVELDLSYCKNVTEDSLMQVGKLKHLKKLSLWGIENVPSAMFYNFRKLEQLRCSHCSLTDEVIIKVIDNCQKLSLLDLRNSGITGNTLVHAANRKFSFKILRIVVNIVEEYSNLNGNKPSPYLKINF